MKRIKITCIIALFLLTGINYSQAQSGKANGAMGFYMPGFQFFTPGELNAHFPAGYPEMSFGRFTQAGSAFSMMKNFVYGWEGGGYEGGPFIKDNIQVDLTGSYNSFEAGYIVLKKNRLFAYPLIGLTWNSIEFYIHQPNQAMTFGTLLADPNQASTLLYKTMNLNLSMTCNYLIGGTLNESGGGGLMLGLQVGYQFPGFTGKWSFDNGDLTDAPGFNMNGFYFRMLIGGGGLNFQN